MILDEIKHALKAQEKREALSKTASVTGEDFDGNSPVSESDAAHASIEQRANIDIHR